MNTPSQLKYQVALRDFQRARKQAALQQLLARMRGESADLLCYDTVRQQLRATGVTVEQGIQEIPLDKIVGSVGRYKDFTRSFLPKSDTDEERWAGVKTAISDMVGMAPIDVYQLGDSYFVQDGNHRVSIARQLGTETISAHVIKVETRVPLTAEDDPNDIICKSFYADFLEKTNLDKLYPKADLLMTFCGQYKLLLDQIEVECKLVKNQQQEAETTDPWEEAVAHWYEYVYLPVIKIIRALGILRRFPARTEADMYVLLSERQDQLEEALDWQVDIETAVTDLLTDEADSANFLNRFVKTVAPAFDPGPEPGLWRQQQVARRRQGHLFADILVALDGTEAGWQLLDYAIWRGTFDNDHILGLHVVPDDALIESEAVQAIRDRFEQRCQAVGLKGEFAVAVDTHPERAIIKRAPWADLVMVDTMRPPAEGALPRLSPGIKSLVQHCTRPIEVVPRGNHATEPANWPDKLILAYDGSPKADEALFVAAYLTARWERALTVVTVETNLTSPARLKQAEQYLTDQGLHDVTYVLEKGPIAEVVLQTAKTYQSQLLVMGGFSYRPVRHLMLGSTAERILREFQYPMLICR